MAPNRAQLWWQVAFNAEPNDPYTMRRWSNLTSMVDRVRQVGRGRQYELAKSLAGQPSINFLDPSEYLNPANASSPYAPNVQPLKEILGQAMWPNAGTGNLINTDMWMPNDITPLDPSFEAYANGAAAPSTLTAVGGITATVTTTNPQQGTKSLTYTVAGTATRQGVAWEVPCVPGEQYTTSAYVRQSSGSTQQLLVGDQNVAWDLFGRTTSNGWGTADAGGAWSTSGGAASDYSTVPNVGKQSNTTTNVRRFSTLAVTAEDQSLRARIRIPAVMTGAIGKAGAIVRYIDSSNYYYCVIVYNTDQTLSFELDKLVAGAATVMTTTTLPFTYAAGDALRIALEVDGGTVRGKCWRDGRTEPATWTLSTTDTALSGPGGLGCHSRLDTGNTNGTVVFEFSDLAMVGTSSSTTTTATGSYVRLTNTFTAAQPSHTVTLCTRGTASAGTINVDAVQHEPGASANAFQTTGPNIFPILRDNLERWPRSNQEDTAGFAGQCDTTAVDGFGALNAITLDPDAVAAVMALQPAYFWRLDSGSGSSSGLETSGNQGPALVPFNSKYGAGFPVEFGSPIEIVGAYGGTGVRFAPVDNSSLDHADTILSLGRVTGSPQLRFPVAGYNATQWSVSIAAWVKCTESDPAGDMVVAAPLAAVGGAAQVPVFVGVSGGAASAGVQGSLSGVSTASAASVDDGVPHLLVGTVTQVAGGNTTVKIYLDGSLANTGSSSTAAVGQFAVPCNVMNVGGAGVNGGQVVNGVVADVALWDRELSASEITGLWTAGGLGYNGELSGARLTRRLTQGRYGGPTRISAGTTAMQPSTAGTTDGLTDAQNITTAEDGTLWVAPDGAVVMEGRQQRWLRLTSRGTFGEDTASGEIPYLDGVVFDFDPSFVFSTVRVSRVNGTVAVGGNQTDIETAARRFFPRSSPADTGDYQTDTIAQDKANWVFASHKAPLQRVSVITVDLGANPSLATKVLPVEVGQRWTVKRRAKAANAAAGITQSEDYFIEKVVHNQIDFRTGAWTISFLMSPIGLVTNQPGVTLQPWILEDATYGVLESTTVLGW